MFDKYTTAFLSICPFLVDLFDESRVLFDILNKLLVVF